MGKLRFADACAEERLCAMSLIHALGLGMIEIAARHTEAPLFPSICGERGKGE